MPPPHVQYTCVPSLHGVPLVAETSLSYIAGYFLAIHFRESRVHRPLGVDLGFDLLVQFRLRCGWKSGQKVGRVKRCDQLRILLLERGQQRFHLLLDGQRRSFLGGQGVIRCAELQPQNLPVFLVNADQVRDAGTHKYAVSYDDGL
jgi:hypothetical protein